MTDITNRLANVKQRIAAAEQRFGRTPGSVQLLAVSKTKPVEDIRVLYNEGQQSFGENYVQELQQKYQALAEIEPEWHFIGPLQSNKTRQIANVAEWVHSIDRFKLAQRLSEQRAESLSDLNICVQVNVSKEDSKSGVTFEDLPFLVENILGLPRIRLRGLMTIPRKAEEFEQQRVPFRLLNQALNQLNQQFSLALDTLSMGMSDDMEAAIAEGATIVRVGTDIFGARVNRP